MEVQVEPSIWDELPSMVQQSLAKLTPEQQHAFVEIYSRRRKSLGLMMFFAIIFPIQLFLLDKIGLGIVFWLTGGGLWVWYVIEIFLTPGRVRTYKQDLAAAVMRDLKIISA